MSDEEPKITGADIESGMITAGYMRPGMITTRPIEVSDLARYFGFTDDAAYLASLGLPADATMDEVQLRLVGIDDVRGATMEELLAHLESERDALTWWSVLKQSARRIRGRLTRTPKR